MSSCNLKPTHPPHTNPYPHTRPHPHPPTRAGAYRSLCCKHVMQAVGGVLCCRCAVVAVKHGGVGTEHAILLCLFCGWGVIVLWVGCGVLSCGHQAWRHRHQHAVLLWVGRWGLLAGFAARACSFPIAHAGMGRGAGTARETPAAPQPPSVSPPTVPAQPTTGGHLTCTACPVEVRGWKELMTVFLSSM